jgi:hypothetical protein
MNKKEEVNVLFSHLLHHLNVAITTGRNGKLNFDSLMYARAVAKALQYSTMYDENQDVIDYVEGYWAMVDMISDKYPILPD